MKRLLSLLFILACTPRGVSAEPVRILVAANFRDCLQVLAEQYTAQAGTQFRISNGATGQLYAQIHAGAPCDLFFAADSERPQLLVDEGWAAAQGRMTYAIGKLVLYSQYADPNPGENNIGLVLDSTLREDGAHLAIANPDLAPYGRAAVQVLRALGRFEAMEPRLVRGQGVGQTWQFVHTGAAQLGFVSLAQIRAATRTGRDLKASLVILVPPDLYDPISQQLVISQDAHPAARPFLDFVLSPAGAVVLEEFGYEVPPK